MVREVSQLYWHGGFPGRLRVPPAPDIPVNTSKPKGRPRKYQDGPFPCLGTASGGGMGISWTPVWPGVGIVAAWFAAGDWDGRHSLRRTQPARISDPKQHVHAAKEIGRAHV